MGIGSQPLSGRPRMRGRRPDVNSRAWPLPRRARGYCRCGAAGRRAPRPAWRPPRGRPSRPTHAGQRRRSVGRRNAARPASRESASATDAEAAPRRRALPADVPPLSWRTCSAAIRQLGQARLAGHQPPEARRTPAVMPLAIGTSIRQRRSDFAGGWRRPVARASRLLAGRRGRRGGEPARPRRPRGDTICLAGSASRQRAATPSTPAGAGAARRHWCRTRRSPLEARTGAGGATLR